MTRVFEVGTTEAVLGDGSGCRVVAVSTALLGFTPGCLRLHARDAASDKEFIADVTDLRARQARDLRVAFLPPDSWSSDIGVTVRSFEQRCDGVQIGVFHQGVTVRPGQVVPASMTLDGRDADNDGFVARNFGGSDCRDDLATVFPGAPELCNGQDDNCDSVQDEGYPNLGSACLDANTQCAGTYQCSPEQDSTVCVPSGSC
ncbi:putative metal-binding motif-containing protein [Myxococcus sp. MISCRS1]|uniref:putative metal-binding motif-containing protein n=1 Tax=Myxococcus TaxID=32 RepID=UPI001CC05ACF|nr:putative metal-binding motif-containing protein [Myxococcus sp. MISCRS1]MBZ4396932.1 putative metal-binding motif-containing protein [Myxococcus sp. AS-1-15]MBZ4408342.1 putative metal-binding motif-containing protein [Myxococcus sp. XM-1-1-1]MCY0996542.1 putative metal-binding motif-containing protein [Myxococcus sp. MISCRS1]BDT33440.1 hypothetical protein MFMH1_31090 [Myxococcus sp. MH1]